MTNPICPDCLSIMVKAFIETVDHSGWQGVWACACNKEDFEKCDTPCVFVHAQPSGIAKLINEIFDE